MERNRRKKSEGRQPSKELKHKHGERKNVAKREVANAKNEMEKELYGQLD